MKTKSCRHCRAEIVATAPTCPQCGVSQSTGSFSPLALVLWLAIGAMSYELFVGWSLPGTRAPAAPKAAATPKPPASAVALEVQASRCERQYGYVVMHGEVRNVSRRPLESVTAVAEFRAASGDVLQVEESLLEYFTLPAGEYSRFRLGGADLPGIAECTLSFRTADGRRLAHREKKSVAQTETPAGGWRQPIGPGTPELTD